MPILRYPQLKCNLLSLTILFMIREWTVEGRIPLRFNPCAPLTYTNEICRKGESFMCAMDPSAPQTGRANVGVPKDLFRNPQSILHCLFS